MNRYDNKEELMNALERSVRETIEYRGDYLDNGDFKMNEAVNETVQAIMPTDKDAVELVAELGITDQDARPRGKNVHRSVGEHAAAVIREDLEHQARKMIQNKLDEVDDNE